MPDYIDGAHYWVYYDDGDATVARFDPQWDPELPWSAIGDDCSRPTEFWSRIGPLIGKKPPTPQALAAAAKAYIDEETLHVARDNRRSAEAAVEEWETAGCPPEDEPSPVRAMRRALEAATRHGTAPESSRS